MTLQKYFWDLHPRALRQTKAILKNPDHPLFVERAFRMLSRCDNPRVVFRVVPKKVFMEGWPKIRRYWNRLGQMEDFLAWWETMYEQLLGNNVTKVLHGTPSAPLIHLGQQIRQERLRRGWNQVDLAKRARIQQPDISSIELGRKNVTIDTLLRICKVLEISQITLF